jgi:hypothetical protein
MITAMDASPSVQFVTNISQESNHSTLKMDAVGSSETTRRHMEEDHNFD